MSYAQELADAYTAAHKRLLEPATTTDQTSQEPSAKPKLQTPTQRPYYQLSPDFIAPKLHQILRLVANAEGLEIGAMISTRRQSQMVLARQMFCYFAYFYTRASCGQIGAILGGRDHTTILHGVRQIQKKVEKQYLWAARIDNLTEQLRRIIQVTPVTHNPQRKLCPLCCHPLD